ncbi:MAG: carboxymuconolactone decarboxylase family protein [Pirellulaceae bacterium]|jgi:alkylhydroperoxidase/carboxymuconolactone decarboxylase family protein YurZ
MGSVDSEEKPEGKSERTVGFSTPSEPMPAKLPGLYRELMVRYPELAAAHDQMGQAAEACGPLDAKSLALVKIGMAVGAGLESAVRSHVRRAGEMGIAQEEITQAIFQGMTTLGFPRTMAAWSWAKVQWDRDRVDRESSEPDAGGFPKGDGDARGSGEPSR